MDLLDVEEVVKICVNDERKAAELLARLARRGTEQSLPGSSMELLVPKSDSSKPRPRVCKKRRIGMETLEFLSEPAAESSLSEAEAQARATEEVERAPFLPKWGGSRYRYTKDPVAPPPLPSAAEQERHRVDLALLYDAEGSSLLPKWKRSASRTKMASVAAKPRREANPPAVAPSPPPPPLPLPSAEHNARPSSSACDHPWSLDLNLPPPAEDEAPAAADPPHNDPPLAPSEASAASSSSALVPSPLNPTRPPPPENNEDKAAAAPDQPDPLPAASPPPDARPSSGGMQRAGPLPAQVNPLAI
uniref:Uncharacterized protein n=1 Tax=Kalanchoe fedtschenkoi TaxID=63787 RepID=A0A7N0TD01_KALFE